MRVAVTEFYERLKMSIRWRLLSPRLPTRCYEREDILTLGSTYGQKTIIHPGEVTNDFVVISGGVGEDISFDIEFMNKFGPCKYYLLDPSPPAIEHVNAVIDSLGQPRTMAYSKYSWQNVQSYELAELRIESFRFFPYALWKEDGQIKFYLPKDGSRDSSGSISAIQNFYVKSQDSIIVKTICVKSFMALVDVSRIDILKLDIEGAPLEVISRMFKDSIYPWQVVLEFDEMHFPSFRSWYRARKLYKLMRKRGYHLAAINSCDYTFLFKGIN